MCLCARVCVYKEYFCCGMFVEPEDDYQESAMSCHLVGYRHQIQEISPACKYYCQPHCKLFFPLEFLKKLHNSIVKVTAIQVTAHATCVGYSKRIGDVLGSVSAVCDEPTLDIP